MEGLSGVREVEVDTPFGAPSGAFVQGSLGGVEMVFLPRHGKGHRLLPTEVNNRANIFGMKKLGVGRILSVSAVGSLKEEIEPGHMVLPDQFIDRTYRRSPTFFGDGVVAHVQFADPFCNDLRAVVADAAAGRTSGCTAAAPTCAWRGRSSPPGPSRRFTGAGARTSSA